MDKSVLLVIGAFIHSSDLGIVWHSGQMLRWKGTALFFFSKEINFVLVFGNLEFDSSSKTDRTNTRGLSGIKKVLLLRTIFRKAGMSPGLG